MTTTGERVIWVTGASGMLGSAVMNAVAEQDQGVKVVGTYDLPIERPEAFGRPDVSGSWLALRQDIDIIINCAGRVPSPTATPADMIRSNALGPHVLAATGLPVVHMSTDCVFSGDMDGWKADEITPYLAESIPDARDTYGRTKALGEVDAPNVVNVRGSFAGWDGGLLRWLLEQRGPIDAWEAAYWTGTSVHLMADLLVRTALRFLDGEIAAGTYHAATERYASKADLLRAIAGALELPVTLRSVRWPAVWRVLAPSPGFVLPPFAVAVGNLVEHYRARVQA